LPTQSLTERTLKSLQPEAGRQYYVWDTTLKGFGVRVSPGGTKTFLYCFRNPSGRQRWKPLGRVGSVSLEQARKLAKVDTATVASGEDPLRQTDEARGAFTLATVAELWMTHHVQARRAAKTQTGYRSALDLHILPALGRTPIGDIDQADAIRLHEALRETPTQANRVVRALSSLLTWAMRGNGRYRPLGPNPCFGIEMYEETKRTRYLTPHEYARIGRALRAASIAPGIKVAILLLLLTGARPTEIASLQWAFVDLRKRALNLPTSKTGAKTIYLSPDAVAALKRWPRHAHSPYVFPASSRNGKGEHLHPSTLTHAWEDLREDLGLADVRLYDSRHSYASVAASVHGLSLPQIGKQLGQTQASTTQRYAHLAETAAQQHAAQIGQTIGAALKRRVKR
jgi:integrase